MAAKYRPSVVRITVPHRGRLPGQRQPTEREHQVKFCHLNSGKIVYRVDGNGAAYTCTKDQWDLAGRLYR